MLSNVSRSIFCLPQNRSQQLELLSQSKTISHGSLILPRVIPYPIGCEAIAQLPLVVQKTFSSLMVDVPGGQNSG